MIEAYFPEKAKPLFIPAPYKVLWGGRGSSKCLALGTRVVMADGSLRAIEEVSEGESVMGPDSKPRLVLSTTRGIGPLYRVSQTSAMDYIVNDAHILSLKKSGSSAKDRGPKFKSGNFKSPRGRYASWDDVTNINVVHASQQSKRWREHFRGYRAGLINFEARKIHVDPYFLGVWLGDGTGREMRITSADHEIVDWCRAYAKREFNIDISICGRHGKARDIGFPHIRRKPNPLWQRFVDYGLPNNKHIPDDFIFNDERSRLELLAGLLDTDGHQVRNYYQITQVNTRLAHDIKRLADSLGFRTNLRRRKTLCTNNGVRGEAWAISISGNAWRIPCRIKRKRLTREGVKPNKDFLLSQVTITPEGIGEYAGFALDGDHLFLLEDGTVTHNSWDCARALLILGSHRKLFIVCGREIQRSIKESVHKLLADQIALLGLSSFYRILDSEIVGVNGTRFVFVGTRNNIHAIKSMEGIDVLWVTEATYISRSHWGVLLPTVRGDPPRGPFKQGSEIWIDFNPELDTDDTYQMFVANPPEGAVVINVNWRDNKFFPEILRKQKDALKASDYDEYLTVWEGKTRRALAGAIYAKELRTAIEEGRISSHVKPDRSRGVTISFDLGKSDMCSLWFMQQVGMEHHAIDYYGNCGFGFDHYLKEIQDRNYIVKQIILPHDAAHDLLAAPKSIEKQTREVYRNPGQVIVLPSGGKGAVTNGVNAVRQLFPRLYINETTCADGLQGLQHYQYAVNPETQQRSKDPLHNFASHPADSLRYYAVRMRDGDKPPDKKEIDHNEMYAPSNAQGWMG